MTTPTHLQTPVGEIRVPDEERKALVEEIDVVLREHRADTLEFMRGLVIIRRLYNLVSRRKSWPWKGAANFIVPIIRFIVDHYVARIKQAFRKDRELWTATHEGPAKNAGDGSIDWPRVSEIAAKFLNGATYAEDHLNLNKEFFPNAVDLVVRDGNVPIKVHFVEEFEKRTVIDSGKRTIIDVPTERRVVWDVIPIHQTIWELGAMSPQDSAVFGHWMEFSRPRFRAFLKRNGVPKAIIDAAIAAPDEPYYLEELRLLDDELGVQKSDSKAARTAGVYRAFELRILWAKNDNTDPAVLKVWYHKGSNQILKVFTTEVGANPWKMARFIPRGKQFLASGIAEPLRVLNLQANTVVNQATDAQTIANARGFAYKSGGTLARAIAKTGIYPGFKAPFDEDFRKEIGTIELGSGNVSASNISLLNFVLQMAEMIGKVGPSQLGSVQSASRVSASVGLGVLQEGSQLIDSVTASFRDTIVECGLETLYLYANHAPDVFSQFLEPDEAALLIRALQQPEFARNVRINIAVTSAQASREKDKQDIIVLAQFMLGIYDRIVANAVPLTSPEIPPVAKAIGVEVYKSLEGLVSELIKQFEQFKDPSIPLSPEIRVLMESIVSGQPPAPGGFFPRAPEAAAGPPTAPPQPAVSQVDFDEMMQQAAAANPEGGAS